MMPSATYESTARCWNTDITREYAEIGSDKLAHAMRQHFMVAALKHGITVRDATLLLQNGVAL